jgi:hypothetical protein
MDERSRHRHFEDQFLSQFRARAGALIKRPLPADRVVFESTPEGIDDIRATLSRLEIHDRDLVEKLPGTRAMQCRFQRSLLGGLFKPTISRLRVRVLASTESLVRGEQPGPVGRERVLDALARYELLPRSARPTGVVFASATGFTPEAQALVESSGPPTLILMGGREDGGWDVAMPARVKSSNWAKLFELETQDDLLKRLTYHLSQSAAELDSRGIQVAELSEKLGLPNHQTEALVRRACRTQSRLMTVVHEGRLHVCRTPFAEEGDTMSIWSRIRRLLRMKPTVAERARELTVQRVQAEQQRFELDQKVNALEGEERDLLQRGSAAAGDAEKKQVAGKLMRARRELRRHRTQAQMFSQQIDIIGTHIHHLTLAEQGKRLELPKAEELTKEAAEAEQVMSELAANADLAAGIEVGAETPMMQEEEAAIFAEFQQLSASSAGAAAAETKTETAASEPPERVAERVPDAPPAPEKPKSARPEMS